ncbi:hypothetical protein K445DRAFT_24368 [Daldinia sp. EC12]|nr:hypothetical protein K445DRAFT_24368 [Daldinia sp. EC12]
MLSNTKSSNIGKNQDGQGRTMDLEFDNRPLVDEGRSGSEITWKEKNQRPRPKPRPSTTPKPKPNPEDNSQNRAEPWKTDLSDLGYDLDRLKEA